MRVPIENGSGYFNQVSDFINLPAALGQVVRRLSYFKLAGGRFGVTVKYTVHVGAACQA